MQRSIKLVSSALAVCLSTLALAEQGQTHIEIIEQCQSQPATENKLVLFGGDINRLTGWSHAEKVDGLALQAKEYYAETKADASCADATVYQNVLVKKYANWDMQHVNGVEPKLTDQELFLKDINSIVLEFKVSSEGSLIPTNQQIETTFNQHLSAEQLQQLDASQINLGLTLFEKGFDDQSTASFNANVFLSLDPELYFDRWVRVTIPANSLNYYTEQNWAPTSIDAADFADTQIYGLRINPETQQGKVARHFIADSFEANSPNEIYKELNISIKSVEFTLN